MFVLWICVAYLLYVHLESMKTFLTWYFEIYDIIFIFSTLYVMLTFFFYFDYSLFGFVMPKRGERYDWLCMYLDAMIWVDTTNMFVEHDVEQVKGQGKHQYTTFGFMILQW